MGRISSHAIEDRGFEMKTLTSVFTKSEIVKIIDFYLFHAPTLKPDEDNEKNMTGLCSLKRFGWYGNQLNELERQLLESSGIKSFNMMKSEKISETLKKQGLAGYNIFPEYPLAVLKIKCTVSIEETGKVKMNMIESRMVCLFRHIRNAIAHSQVYILDDDFILLEDKDKKTTTAKILLKRNTLLDWIKIVMKEDLDDEVTAATKDIADENVIALGA